jgi:murein DD-endopeptidase MepM/ murein hydrolase activator NlpD
MRGRAGYRLCIVLFILSIAVLLCAESTWTMREGETLFAVAKKAQIPVDVLCAFNGIADAAKVKAGTLIRFPVVYAVKKGDTLYAIARANSAALQRLLELNKLTQSSSIKAGDRLYIPVESAQAVAKAADSKQDPKQDSKQGLQPPQGVVLPHSGRYGLSKGRLPGLVFYGVRGDPVRSASAGEVKWVAPFWGYGKAVIIKSPDGAVFTYMGNEEILVNVGDRVVPGAEIARLGESPREGTALLYFSIKDARGNVIDPEKYFSVKNQA